MSKIKLIAFDLDGTLTQHKEPLTAANRAVLDQLAKRYKLVMAGAGQTGGRQSLMNMHRNSLIIIMKTANSLRFTLQTTNTFSKEQIALF